MPVKVNLWPLGRVNSWAKNTNKARMAKIQASTEVACTVWRYSTAAGRQNRHTVREGSTLTQIYYHVHLEAMFQFYIYIVAALLILLIFRKLLLITFEHNVELYRTFFISI